MHHLLGRRFSSGSIDFQYAPRIVTRPLLEVLSELANNAFALDKVDERRELTREDRVEVEIIFTVRSSDFGDAAMTKTFGNPEKFKDLNESMNRRRFFPVVVSIRVTRTGGGMTLIRSRFKLARFAERASSSFRRIRELVRVSFLRDFPIEDDWAPPREIWIPCPGTTWYHLPFGSALLMIGHAVLVT